MKVYNIAAKHGIPILEDDYDHEYHYRSYPLAPMASNDPAGIIIYASSFTKTVFPSIRLGFLAVPKGLSDPIERYKNITSRQQNLINQKTVANWIAGGGFERHLRKMRKTYEKRKDIMIGCLEIAKSKGIDLAWTNPEGGMAIWLNTFQNSEDIATWALRHNIRLLHENLFRFKRKGGTHLRLGFAHLSENEIKQGMEKVFKAF
jgi:GntR family transcriptional regulator/MocR family aminotransferase